MRTTQIEKQVYETKMKIRERRIYLCPVRTGVVCISYSKNSIVTKVWGSAFPNMLNTSFLIVSYERIGRIYERFIDLE